MHELRSRTVLRSFEGVRLASYARYVITARLLLLTCESSAPVVRPNEIGTVFYVT